jgi:hypothetical protein
MRGPGEDYSDVVLRSAEVRRSLAKGGCKIMEWGRHRTPSRGTCCATAASPKKRRCWPLTSGYVQRIDHKRLLHAVGQREAVVCVMFRPGGQFTLEGEALAHVLRGAELRAAIHGTVMIGQHRDSPSRVPADRAG